MWSYLSFSQQLVQLTYNLHIYGMIIDVRTVDVKKHKYMYFFCFSDDRYLEALGIDTYPFLLTI